MSDRAELIEHAALQVGSTCVALHLQRAARRVTRAFDQALRPTGLTIGQFSLLMALNRTKPPTIGELAKDLAMDRTTLTAYLKPLRRRGLVDVSSHAGDARSRLLTLSDHGRQTLAEAYPLWRRAQDATLADHRLGDVDALRRNLKLLSV